FYLACKQGSLVWGIVLPLRQGDRDAGSDLALAGGGGNPCRWWGSSHDVVISGGPAPTRSLLPAAGCPGESRSGIWLPVSARAAARGPARVCGRVNMIPRLLSWRTAVGPFRNSCRPSGPGSA